ncbi:MAG TPA: methylenetetrahydrofolate reductase C-terminal domain-containing protein [bacterium]
MAALGRGKIIGAPFPNSVRQGLASQRFVLTVEVATPSATEPFDRAIRSVLALAREIRDDPRIDALALTDRSRSDHDHDPLLTGHRVAQESGKMPIVHWAGKDRTLRDWEADLQRTEKLGLDTFLLVTGDKVRQPRPDRPVRYLDSVNALDVARQRSAEFLLGGAVSPFKYREEELVNQYLKAAKKLRAGANFLMTQIGWDVRKFQELRWFLDQRGYRAALIAECLFLTPARSQRIRMLGLPGVTITDDLAQRLQETAASPDGGQAAAFRRLALQIAGARDLGYAGAQISGLETYASIVRLLDDVETVTQEYPTPEARRQGWLEQLMLKDGRTAQVAPADGLYLQVSAFAERAGPPAKQASTGAGEWLRFRVMDVIDHLIFKEGSIAARALAVVLRRLDARAGAGGILLRIEHAIKEPLVGCQSCGFCRLPHTVYVCPETCPKGLASGPCGGTKDNRCEFGDRECIHNQIYRISKQAGLLSNLEEVLIPPVPEAAWDSCSWVTHFRGEGPQVKRLQGNDFPA